jgi:hypothetical protein
MRRHPVSLLAVLLLAATAGSARAAAPVIERVDVENDRYRSLDITVLVSDEDGADDLASVTIVTPSGTDIIIAPERTPWAWQVEGPNTIIARVGLTWDVGQDGLSYLITAADIGGLEESLTAPYPPQAPGGHPEILYPDPDEQLVFETVPTFRWSEWQEGADNSLLVWGTAMSWRYDAGQELSAVYNADGLASQPELTPGYTYLVKVTSRLWVDRGLTDPRVYVSLVEDATAHFVVYSPSPVVQNIGFYCYILTQGGGWVARSEDMGFTVTDGDGAEDIVSVTITYPNGLAYTIPPANGDWEWSHDGLSTVGVSRRNRVYLPEEPPPVGAYTVAAEDAAGHQGTKDTPWLDLWSELRLVTPQPDSVIEETQPTFSLHTGAGDSYTTIGMTIFEEGRASPIWSTELRGETATVYNWDGSAEVSELRPGRTYLCKLWADTYDADTGDPEVHVQLRQEAAYRFTVLGPWPALPELPGRLAYTMVLIPAADVQHPDAGYYHPALLYDPDPCVRRWLGPVNAWNADLSADGQKLVYSTLALTHLDWTLTGLTTMFIDLLDGGPPVGILGKPGWDAQWAPDGEHIVYANWVYDWVHDSEGWDTWITDLTGAEAYALVAEPMVEERYPAWSPDGEWILYRRLPDDVGQGLWIVRPDGTDAQPVLTAGVEGYPDHQITNIGEPCWSPSSDEIAVSFALVPPVGEAVWGIGVIPREGGTVSPVFLAPPGVACCAAPRIPAWSPDGTMIAFGSAHHLPVDEEWASGKYEPGSELWVIDADGSGEPVRLTYNYSFERTVSWRDWRIFPDVKGGHWATSEIAACLDAGVVAGYSDGLYHPEWPVTRAQMAVYIARALAGGDENVPDGGRPRSFLDVPRDHWAFDHIEYCVDNGVVGGYGRRFYHPEYPVTRDQMAVYVARALVAPTGEAALADYVPADPRDFPDVASDFWSYKHVEYCVENGVVAGYLDGLYHPEIVVTRDQMVVYVARAFGLTM